MWKREATIFHIKTDTNCKKKLDLLAKALKNLIKNQVYEYVLNITT